MTRKVKKWKKSSREENYVESIDSQQLGDNLVLCMVQFGVVFSVFVKYSHSCLVGGEEYEEGV